MARNNCKISAGSMEQLSITFNSIILSKDKQPNPINPRELTRFHLRIRLRNLYMSHSERSTAAIIASPLDRNDNYMDFLQFYEANFEKCPKLSNI